MRLSCSLLVIALGQAFQPPNPTTPNPAITEPKPTEAKEPGAIAGRVVDSTTNEPIRKAVISLVLTLPTAAAPKTGAAAAPLVPSAFSAGRAESDTVFSSDATGNFRGPVPPGTYMIRSTANGYVPSPTGEAVTIASGETAKGITVKMRKQGVIAGRVTDDEGDPLSNVSVQALRWTISSMSGKRALMTAAMSQSNDLGEYRLHGIPPGKYVISASPGDARVAGARQALVPIYFPGVTDSEAAQALEVTPGSTRQGLDLRLAKLSVVTIRGKVNNFAGQAMAHLGKAGAFPFSDGRNSSPVNPRGEFLLQNVPSGSYIVTVYGMSPTQRGHVGRTAVEVGKEDVKGITIEMELPLALNLRVVAPDKPDLSSFNLFMQALNPGFFGGGGGRVDAEGKGVIQNLTRDIYNFRANGVPEDYYIRSAQLGRADALEKIDLTAGTSDELVITLEKGSAEISGKVLTGEKPAVGAVVVALNHRNETAAISSADPNGRYHLKGLAPGDYRLGVSESNNFSEADTFDRLLESAKPITLAKSARETRDLELKQ